jgi:dTDP-glucose 4,6-dehydratase
MDPRKLETELGWRPAYSFDEGMAHTVRWYQKSTAWVARAIERVK